MDTSKFPRKTKRSPEPSPSRDEWGTIQDAADLKKVSTKTIRRYISQGLIEAERFGPRLIRVNLASVDAVGRSMQHTGRDAE